MFTLMSQADVVKAIPVLAADAATVQERIHVIACSTLDHVRAHGDTTGCVALCSALPKGQRVKALAHWFKHFSSNKLILTWDKKLGAWAAKLSKDRSDQDFKVTESMETTFADLTEEREPVSVTVESMLRNLTRNSTNTEMHDDGITPKVDPAARAFAAELIAFARSKGLDKKAA
jgi:hypothetical protein